MVSAPTEIHSIPVIDKTPPLNPDGSEGGDGDTPVAAGADSVRGNCPPVTPPLWDELQMMNVKNDSFAEEKTPLTPLELRAMGPPLMPHTSSFDTREHDIIMSRAEAQYEACIMMNQIYVSDSLASKRSMWLDVSARMWQKIASSQADDAMRTAKSLKQKEEMYGQTETLRTTLSQLQEQVTYHSNLLDDRKKRIYKLDAEIEAKSLESRLHSGDITDDEHQHVTRRVLMERRELQRAEELLAAREKQAEANLKETQARVSECEIWEAKASRIQHKEIELASREAEMDQREAEVKALDEALQKERADYAASRERLLFEYAEIAEREAAAEENSKAVQSTWKAACTQQAEAQNYEKRSSHLLASHAQALHALSEIYLEHAMRAAEIWTTAAPTSTTHFAKIRASARVVPSPHMATTPTVTHRRSMSPRPLMSPSVYTKHRPVEVSVPKQENLSYLEQNLRERYSIQHSQPARHELETSPVRKPDLGDRLRDKLREETKKLSYESRLKELLKETQRGGLQSFESGWSADLSMADDWARNRTPSSSPAVSARGVSVSQVPQPVTSVVVPVPVGQATPRRASAPKRDLTSPKVGSARQLPQTNTSVDTVFKQIREMEDFLSGITAPRARHNLMMPPVMSEAP